MSEDEEKTGYIELVTECPFCGGLIPDDFECIKCGAELLEEREDEKLMYVCSSCRKVVDDDVHSCPHCNTSFL